MASFQLESIIRLIRPGKNVLVSQARLHQFLAAEPFFNQVGVVIKLTA